MRTRAGGGGRVAVRRRDLVEPVFYIGKGGFVAPYIVVGTARSDRRRAEQAFVGDVEDVPLKSSSAVLGSRRTDVEDCRCAFEQQQFTPKARA